MQLQGIQAEAFSSHLLQLSYCAANYQQRAYQRQGLPKYFHGRLIVMSARYWFAMERTEIMTLKRRQRMR